MYNIGSSLSDHQHPNVHHPSHAQASTSKMVAMCDPNPSLVTICAPIPLAKMLHPKLAPNPSNSITSSPLRSQVSTGNHFLHWLTLFGFTILNKLMQHLPPHIIARKCIILVKSIKPKTLSNHS